MAQRLKRKYLRYRALACCSSTVFWLGGLFKQTELNRG
jgi:hypothetical protein